MNLTIFKIKRYFLYFIISIVLCSVFITVLANYKTQIRSDEKINVYAYGTDVYLKDTVLSDFLDETSPKNILRNNVGLVTDQEAFNLKVLMSGNIVVLPENELEGNPGSDTLVNLSNLGLSFDKYDTYKKDGNVYAVKIFSANNSEYNQNIYQKYFDFSHVKEDYYILILNNDVYHDSVSKVFVNIYKGVKNE